MKLLIDFLLVYNFVEVLLAPVMLQQLSKAINVQDDFPTLLFVSELSRVAYNSLLFTFLLFHYSF